MERTAVIIVELLCDLWLASKNFRIRKVLNPHRVRYMFGYYHADYVSYTLLYRPSGGSYAPATVYPTYTVVHRHGVG